MLIVGILGPAGSGKDTMADELMNQHDFVKVAMADPLKRICREVYDFSDTQLWGPSQERNKEDKRYLRSEKVTSQKGCCVGVEQEFLTPRMALQTLGTEWGRAMYPGTWVDYALRVIQQLKGGHYSYDQKNGLVEQPGHEGAPSGVAIPDVRFQNEIDAIHKAGGYVVRIRRPGKGGDVKGGVAGHASEREMEAIPDSVFDAVINNDGELVDFYLSITTVLANLYKRELEVQTALRGMDRKTVTL
jgi:hypothetical protein